MFFDLDEAGRAFDAECATGHPGREVTVRLLEFERLGVMWQSARDIAVWHPADPLGPWTEEGRLNSGEVVRPVGAGMLRRGAGPGVAPATALNPARPLSGEVQGPGRASEPMLGGGADNCHRDGA
jgi:hypothetical protein